MQRTVDPIIERHVLESVVTDIAMFAENPALYGEKFVGGTGTK
jgi:hypothetical protein